MIAVKIRLIPVLLASLTGIAQGAAEIGYNKDIRPILSNKCFQCHGPDEGARKAKLRLDQASGDHGAHRIHKGIQAIKPGDLENSELWHRITTEDVGDVMPPPDSHVDAITGDERALIKEWIMDGAEYEDFWAFVPPRDAGIPEPTEAAWSDQSIDRFVLARLEKAGVKPSPRADRRSLIRRVSFDLTGLPPSLEEIQAFLDDGSKNAYEGLVDRFLAKPQYGEHMAKYWLDLVRFADTSGMHHDHYRDMTPFRDWVIRSFNENLGYDQFVLDQVAGDLHPEPSTDQLIASGFNRLHLIIDRGTALPEESFTKNVIDRVAAVGTAFMGLTLQCAVCHDHKFDPITQKDFYQLSAFFNNFDGGPETGGRGGMDFKRGLQAPYINLPDDRQALELKAIDEKVAKLEADDSKKANPEADDSKKAKLETDESKKAEIDQLRKERDAILATVPAAMIMKERAQPRATHILIRGAYDNPGAEVDRGTPGFLPPIGTGGGTAGTGEDQGRTKDRMDFAKWLVAPSNPLTARVAANRFWQQFFGVGLVKTSEDFGAQGEWPSHPGLLDHLTLEFINSGWDVKALVRSFVLSQTYQQSSKAAREMYADDPDNRLLARGARFRLDSEMIRDQILATSGLLNDTMFGKSVKPPQPDGLWKIVAMPFSYPREYIADTGQQIYRRSVYTFWKRGLPPPQMTIFDAPNRDACIARRERTNTPLQALLLMNEEQYFDAAKHLADELLASEHVDDDARLGHAYEAVTSQLAPVGTMSQLRGALEEFRELYRTDVAAAEAMIPDPAEAESRTELAAWTMLVHSLFNLDTTKTRE